MNMNVFFFGAVARNLKVKFDASWIDDVCNVCPFPRVCYERCPINPTAATFLLSAMWHGVYPGYYLTFLTGIVMTMAARAVSTHQHSAFAGLKKSDTNLNPRAVCCALPVFVVEILSGESMYSFFL